MTLNHQAMTWYAASLISKYIQKYQGMDCKLRVRVKND